MISPDLKSIIFNAPSLISYNAAHDFIGNNLEIIVFAPSACYFLSEESGNNCDWITPDKFE
jgi:hypothetical protein